MKISGEHTSFLNPPTATSLCSLDSRIQCVEAAALMLSAALIAYNTPLSFDNIVCTNSTICSVGAIACCATAAYNVFRSQPTLHRELEAKLAQAKQFSAQRMQTIEEVQMNLLIATHADQLKSFESWTREGYFGSFRRNHYDWWMFPIDRTSVGQGDKYRVDEKRVQALKNRPEFMENYRRGVELMLQSWGWDLFNSRPVDSPLPAQAFDGHLVRLGKVLQSLELFGEKELFDSVQQFARGVVDPNCLTGDLSYLSAWIY